MPVLYNTNVATSDNQVTELATLASILTQLQTIATDDGTTNTQLASVIAALAPLATAANQAADNATLVSILTALASLATSVNQTVANTALAAIATAIQDLDAKFGSTNAIISNVVQSTATQIVLPSNPGRKGFYLFNNSGQKVFVAYAATATSSAFTLMMPANSGYESSQNSCYKGAISVIFGGAGGGALLVTEMT